MHAMAAEKRTKKGSTTARGQFTEEELRAGIDKAVKQLGYDCVQGSQLPVIKHFMSGQDVFVCLPTGYGKSLCYCILPILFDILHQRHHFGSIAIVVSPLIALMKDQVRQMKERDVRAVYVGDVNEKAESDVFNGRYQLVYLSPEALLTEDRWRDMLQSDVYKQNLVAFVVDEAHCVKKW